MNDKYFKNRIENSPLGSAGLKLLNAQEKLISQEYTYQPRCCLLFLGIHFTFELSRYSVITCVLAL